MKVAHDPADGWTAIASETGWPSLDSPLPEKQYKYKRVVINDSDITLDMISAGIEVYRTYLDQVFPRYEDVVREIYRAMQAAK